jgi:hypothetical protein
MSFTKVGFYTLSPGASVRWGVIRNGGQDFGAQYVGGDPETPGELIFSDQSKYRGDDGRFGYNFTVRNPNGSRAISFSMQGGGFV